MFSHQALSKTFFCLFTMFCTKALAVHIDSRGIGEVLLFPYYTTTGGYDTYINLLNTRNEAKAVKLRIRESMNGASVQEVNIYLSPNDHWSAVIYANPDGPGTILQSGDHSCALPSALPSTEKITLDSSNYQGDSLNGLERTREGSIEVIEMAVVNAGTMDWPALMQQDSSGDPVDCAALESAWEPGGAWSLNPLDGMAPASGGLSGYATLIDVEEGTNATYDAIAIDNFTPSTGTALHTSIESELPTLASGDTRYTLMNDGEFVSGEAASGIDAISALLMQASLTNDFILEPTIAAGTEWVVTFPTKHEYVNGANLAPPFNVLWDSENSSACEEFSFLYGDRESARPASPPITPPPPLIPPLPEETLVLCAQANVFSFADGYPAEGILEADNGRNRKFIFLEDGFDNGWATMGFDFTRPRLTAGSFSFGGLPVIGFALQRFVNGSLIFDGHRVLSNYAGVVLHKGHVDIEIE